MGGVPVLSIIGQPRPNGVEFLFGAVGTMHLVPWNRRTIMAKNNSISSANERLVRQINQEARQDPKSVYAGKLVGIANGQVVVVADSWREVAMRLRQVEPDPTKCRCIEASADYDRVEEIWSAV
jgi:hypothetical protein